MRREHSGLVCRLGPGGKPRFCAEATFGQTARPGGAYNQTGVAGAALPRDQASGAPGRALASVRRKATMLNLAFIQNIGVPGFVIIVIALLLLFGGKKLPELARGLGKGLRGFKEELDGKSEGKGDKPAKDEDDKDKA